MSPTSRSQLVRYGVALSAVAIAFLARMSLDPFLGNHHPFTTFYVAVTAVAWYAGLGPALLTIVLGYLAGDYFFISPRYAIDFSKPEHLADLSCFLFVGVVSALFTEAMRAAQRQAEAKALEALQKRKELELEVTERKRLEGELKLRADELVDADRRKDEFLAMLGHELRNPLAPIRNALEIVHTKGSSEVQREWAWVVIDRQVAQMIRLVDDLLEASRIRQGKIGLRKEATELAAIIEHAVESSRALIAARKHELIESLPEEPVWLEVDPVRLAQVIANLLNNAAKYTPDRGHIWLLARIEGEEAVIRIRDAGMGISPEMLPRIFDLFSQEERTLAQSQGGLGIGLTLVKTLVEMHGGSITATSEGTGKGSEFVVRLPAMAERRLPPRTDSEDIATEAPCRRILLVDDNVDAAESLALLLSTHQNDVRTVHDGPTALETARAFQPDIIFLDIGLPGMDGYEVARRIRDDKGIQQPLLVALTGYGREEDLRRAEHAGFEAHVVKPAKLAALQRLLAQATGAR
jgi:signal transduction histidine kinase/ActR/RegA family two-component response regulator